MNNSNYYFLTVQMGTQHQLPKRLSTYIYASSVLVVNCTQHNGPAFCYDGKLIGNGEQTARITITARN